MTQKSHNLIPWHGTVQMRIFLSRVLYQSFANKALQQAEGGSWQGLTLPHHHRNAGQERASLFGEAKNGKKLWKL